MTQIEFIILILAAGVGFWMFIWLGDLIAKSVKLFDYDRFRHFLKRL